MKCDVKHGIRSSGFLGNPGLWAVVDGQYGSTGKGLASSVLAEAVGHKVNVVVSNAGPNSGHTSYGPKGEKVVLCQLPTMAVAQRLFNPDDTSPDVCMTAGAIIDPDRFTQEVTQWLGTRNPGRDGIIYVNPTAAVVSDAAKKFESDLIQKIGSTGKGTGGALAMKVLRMDGATANSVALPAMVYPRMVNPRETAFMEVSQGFSLSLNASGFYPYTTSRDCTVMQGMADAGIHPSLYQGCMMVVRTFPIRVAGNSGPCYPDQKETSWEELEQVPEITTVTKKVRRVFTWSDIQFRHALFYNRPCSLFINFIQYLPEDQRTPFVRRVLGVYYRTIGKAPRLVLIGKGPYNTDVEVFDER